MATTEAKLQAFLAQQRNAGSMTREDQQALGYSDDLTASLIVPDQIDKTPVESLHGSEIVEDYDPVDVPGSPSTPSPRSIDEAVLRPSEPSSTVLSWLYEAIAKHMPSIPVLQGSPISTPLSNPDKKRLRCDMHPVEEIFKSEFLRSAYAFIQGASTTLLLADDAVSSKELAEDFIQFSMEPTTNLQESAFLTELERVVLDPNRRVQEVNALLSFFKTPALAVKLAELSTKLFLQYQPKLDTFIEETVVDEGFVTTSIKEDEIKNFAREQFLTLRQLVQRGSVTASEPIERLLDALGEERLSRPSFR